MNMDTTPGEVVANEKTFNGIVLRIVSEFPNYGFSQDGHGYNLNTGKQIGSIDKVTGYTICLMTNKDGRPSQKRRMHRMIIWAWTGNDPGDNDVDHINTEKSDNRLENLRVVSRADHRRITHLANPGHNQRSASKRAVPLIAVNERTGETLCFTDAKTAGAHFGITDGAIRHHMTDQTRFQGWSFAKEDLTYADEEWRLLNNNYPGLMNKIYVSNYGRVNSGRQPTFGNLRESYYMYAVNINGTRHERQVAELVCWAFHGPRPEGARIQVNHIDHNRQNNRPENLEWTDHVRNTQLAKGTHFEFKGKDGQVLSFPSENELLRSREFKESELRLIYEAAATGQPYKDWHVTVSRAQERRDQRDIARTEDPNTTAVLLTAVPPVTIDTPIYHCDLDDPRSRTPSMDMRFPGPDVERCAAPGYEAYHITENGQILSHRQSTVLKTKLREGLVFANLLTEEGKRRYVDAALLVALAFSENPDPNTYVAVRAINGNPYDRRLENLEWCTARQYTAYRQKLRAIAAATSVENIKTPEE